MQQTTISNFAAFSKITRYDIWETSAENIVCFNISEFSKLMRNYLFENNHKFCLNLSTSNFSKNYATNHICICPAYPSRIFEQLRKWHNFIARWHGKYIKDLVFLKQIIFLQNSVWYQVKEPISVTEFAHIQSRPQSASLWSSCLTRKYSVIYFVWKAFSDIIMCLVDNEKYLPCLTY